MSNGRDGVYKAPEILGDVMAKDLFPDAVTFEEMDRHIRYSETRTRFWIVACVASNLILALPTVFYVGRMAQAVEQMSASVKDLQSTQRVSDDWIKDRMIWEAKMEVALRSKGVEVK